MNRFQRGDFERAADVLGRAIARTRRADTREDERLKIEPAGWFHRGLAYYRMGAMTESAMSFEALLEGYGDLPELILRDAKGDKLAARLRELSAERGARLKGSVARIRGSKRMKAQIEKLDVLVRKAANNFRIAAMRRQRETAEAFDFEIYKRALKLSMRFDEKSRASAGFLYAQAIREQAEALEKSGKAERAARIYEEAATAYGEILEASAYHVKSRFTAGYMNFRAMHALKGKESPRLRANARAALVAWKRFEAVAQGIDPLPGVREAIERSLASIRYARPSIHFALKNYDRAIDSVAAFMQASPQDAKQIGAVLWTGFKANRELARVAQELNVIRSRIDSMEQIAARMVRYEGIKTRYDAVICNYLAATWSHGASFIQARLQRRDLDDTARQKLTARYTEFSAASTAWLERLTGVSPAHRTPRFMGHIARKLFALKDYAGAQKMYRRVRKKLDSPEVAIAEAEFHEKARSIYRSDLRETRRLASAVSRKIPALIFDEKKRDYGDAIDGIDAIIGNPDAKPPIEGSAPDIACAKFLARVRDELDRRLMRLQTMRQIGACAIRLAEAAGVRDAEAAAHWAEAARQFQSVLKYRADDVAVIGEIARCSFEAGVLALKTGRTKQALKHLDKARKLQHKMRAFTRQGTADYWKAYAALVRTEFEMGRAGYAARGKSARARLTFFLYSVAADRRSAYWPDIESFRKRAGVKDVKIENVEIAPTDMYEPVREADQALLTRLRGSDMELIMNAGLPLRHRRLDEDVRKAIAAGKIDAGPRTRLRRRLFVIHLTLPQGLRLHHEKLLAEAKTLGLDLDALYKKSQAKKPKKRSRKRRRR